MPFPTSTNPGLGMPPGQRPRRDATGNYETPPIYNNPNAARPRPTLPYGQRPPAPKPQAPAPYNPAPPNPFRPGGGVPSPLSGNAVIQRPRAPVPQAPPPPPPPAYNPGFRTRTGQAGTGDPLDGSILNAPRVEGSWNPTQEANFNALQGIDPQLIWAHQYNIDNNLNDYSNGGENYGWEAAQQVRSILPPRIMQQVDSGQLPLHMALLQYMNFLRGRGLS